MKNFVAPPVGADRCAAAAQPCLEVRGRGTHVEALDAGTRHLVVMLPGAHGTVHVAADGLEIPSAAPDASFLYLAAGRARTLRTDLAGPSVRLSIGPGVVRGHPAYAPLARGVTAQRHAYDGPLLAIAEIARAQACRGLPSETALPLARALLARLAQCVRPPAYDPSALPAPVRAALDYIEGNLGAPLALGDLAARMGASRSAFARLFRDATGETLRGYVAARRCARAAHMLRRTDAPIARIAHEAGFGSQSYMTTVMRQRGGRTPGELRRDAREETRI